MTDLIEAPELKQLGTQALQDLLTNLTQAKGFILEQAPEFCQQLVDRGIHLPLLVVYIAAGFAVLSVLWALLGLVIAKINGEVGDGSAFMVVSGVVGLIASFGVAAHHGYAAYAVYLAPKVYLVEEITRMLK